MRRTRQLHRRKKLLLRPPFPPPAIAIENKPVDNDDAETLVLSGQPLTQSSPASPVTEPRSSQNEQPDNLKKDTDGWSTCPTPLKNRRVPELERFGKVCKTAEGQTAGAKAIVR